VRTRTAATLAIVAVIVLGAGWYFGPHQNPSAQQQVNAGRLLFPGIAAPLERAQKIEIVHAGKRFAITRTGNVWGLPDRGSYPVQATKVHAMLAGLTELRLLAKRTSDPTQFAALGLDNPTRPGSTATLLTVSDSAGHAIASLVVGHQQYSTTSQNTETLYVRRPGENQTWLAEGALNVDSDPGVWIDHSIANIGHDSITHVAITRGEESLVFSPLNGKLTLAAPAQHPPLDPNKLDDVWRALEFLSFSDVRQGPALPGKEFARSIFSLAGGTTITVTLAHDGKDLWAHFAAAGSDAQAKTLAAKFGTWTYRLGDWRESALAPTLADLLSKPPAPKP
jgi:Domain of unknown function (DUF4340)